MIYLLRVVAVMCWLMVLSASSHAVTISKIVGVSIDGTPPPPPSGLCPVPLNMTNVGILPLAEEASHIQMGIGPLENAGVGFAYATVRTATFDTKQYVINMGTFAVAGTTNINISDNPDNTNTLNASHYNAFEQKWTVIGQKLSAPCTSCLHFRTYSNGNILVDDALPGPTTNSGADFNPTVDSDNVYVLYATSGGQRLGKFETTGYSTVDTVLVSAVDGSQGLANDATFVYGSFNAASSVKRWLKSNIAAGATDFTPGFVAGTLQGLTYDTNGNLYVPARSAGLSANVVYKVRTSDMTIVGQLNLGNSQFLGKVLVDTVNDKLYVFVSSGSTNLQLLRVNRNTLAVEQTFNGSSATNGPRLEFSQIDVLHQTAYVLFNGAGGEVAKIQKISLCPAL